MSKSISMKKVGAMLMTVLAILIVNTAFSHSGSIKNLKTVKQFSSWNSLRTTISIASAPRPETNLAADMGSNPPGPRPSVDLAADMGNNPPGPRPSVDIATVGDILSTRTMSVRFVSARDGFPQSPRPTM